MNSERNVSKIPTPRRNPTIALANKVKRKSMGILRSSPPAPKKARPLVVLTNGLSNAERIAAGSRAPMTGRATMASTTGPAARPVMTSSRRPSPIPVTAPASRVASRRPSVQDKHRELEIENESLKAKMAAYEVEMDAKVAGMEAKIVEMEAKQDASEKKVEMYQLRLEKEETKVEQKDMKIETLEARLESKDTMLARKTEMLDGKSEQLDKLKVEYDQIKSELAEGLKQLAAVTADLCEAERRMKHSLSELMHKDLLQRKLLNEVVDLKGQIRVAVRVRPPLAVEKDVGLGHIQYLSQTAVKLELNGKGTTFDFQKVYGPNMTQARIFTDVEELILSCLHGYNVSIIAFGQTGSGKTHTMRGGEREEAGLIPRAVQFLFASKSNLEEIGWTIELGASYLEVYNEEVYDLLAKRTKLCVKMGQGAADVEGLTWRTVCSEEEIENILAIADSQRSTAATKCNEQSSRSHAVFELKVVAKNKELDQMLTSSLHLVDLAGSERAKESQVEGERFKEMTNINQGLSTLQNCIRQQLQKVSHISYRNSKLTMLLKSSLGAGSSKTMVIVALNPSIANANETKRSLEFAQQMSATKIGAAMKQDS